MSCKKKNILTNVFDWSSVHEFQKVILALLTFDAARCMMHHFIYLIRKHQLMTQIVVHSFALIINVNVHCCFIQFIALMVHVDVWDFWTATQIDINTFGFALNLMQFYRITKNLRIDLSSPYSIFSKIIIIDDCTWHIWTIKNDMYIVPNGGQGLWKSKLPFTNIRDNNESIRVFVHCTLITYNVQL